MTLAVRRSLGLLLFAGLLGLGIIRGCRRLDLPVSDIASGFFQAATHFFTHAGIEVWFTVGLVGGLIIGFFISLQVMQRNLCPMFNEAVRQHDKRIRKLERRGLA